MKLVQRGNKQLRAADGQLEALLRSGYVEVDEKTGKPVRAPAESDPAALKKELAAVRKENGNLKAQVKDLSAQVEDLTKDLSALMEGLTKEPEG